MRFIPIDQVVELETHLADLIRTGRRGLARDALGIALGLQGLRVSEVCQLRTGHLDKLAGTISPPIIKRSRSRSLPLDRTFIDALRTWRNGSPVPWLLYTVQGNHIYPSHLQRFCRTVTAEVYGVEFHFHALRHTFAMRLYAKTKDLLLVKRLLGHRSITSTQVYADALDELPQDMLFKLEQPEQPLPLFPLDFLSTPNSSKLSENLSIEAPQPAVSHYMTTSYDVGSGVYNLSSNCR